MKKTILGVIALTALSLSTVASAAPVAAKEMVTATKEGVSIEKVGRPTIAPITPGRGVK